MNDKADSASTRISEFLTCLGLLSHENVNTPSYWEACWSKIRRAGGEPDAILKTNEPMARDVGNMYFMTPEIACHFLAADLPRLHRVLENLETTDIIPPSATHVAEIGGGPGIVSLWLAREHPEVAFVVYDYAENPLKVGRQWARLLGVTNVTYREKSYRQLAEEKPEQAFDLVLGLGSLDLNLEPPKGKHGLSLEEHTIHDKDAKVVTLHEFSRACSRLLKPNGFLYFTQGSFNDLGLLCLFDAFRKHNLGVNWEHTRVRGEGEGPSFSIKEILIVACPDLPSVFNSAVEDTQTFLFSGKVKEFREKTVLGYADFDAYLSLLSDGCKLADIKTRHGDNTTERHCIYVKSGLLGFFSSNSRGMRSGFVYSAASFASCCRKLLGVIQASESRNIRITEAYWHPIFE